MLGLAFEDHQALSKKSDTQTFVDCNGKKIHSHIAEDTLDLQHDKSH